MVHARDGRLLRDRGGPGGGASVCGSAAVPFWGLGPGSPGIGGGEASRDMVRERSRGFTGVRVGLLAEDHRRFALEERRRREGIEREREREGKGSPLC